MRSRCSFAAPDTAADCGAVWGIARIDANRLNAKIGASRRAPAGCKMRECKMRNLRFEAADGTAGMANTAITRLVRSKYSPNPDGNIAFERCRSI